MNGWAGIIEFFLAVCMQPNPFTDTTKFIDIHRCGFIKKYFWLHFPPSLYPMANTSILLHEADLISIHHVFICLTSRHFSLIQYNQNLDSSDIKLFEIKASTVATPQIACK